MTPNNIGKFDQMTQFDHDWIIFKCLCKQPFSKIEGNSEN